MEITVTKIFNFCINKNDERCIAIFKDSTING